MEGFSKAEDKGLLQNEQKCSSGCSGPFCLVFHSIFYSFCKQTSWIKDLL